MKRLAIGIALCLTVAASVFAQSDLTPLAVVKLNKSETITLKNLKTRVTFLEKQYETHGVQKKLTVDERKQILDTLIQEKLIAQAAAKENMVITDSQVDAAFLNIWSQQIGQQVTEAQLSDLIKQQTGQTLDAYILQNTGMSLVDYKAYLKNQLVGQQYVFAKKQTELQNVSASDAEIRQAYDLNKSSFVWNDMAKLFLVMVPKQSDAVAARALCADMRKQFQSDKTKEDAFKTSSDNGTKYAALNLFVQKTSAQAQQLRWSYDYLLELFGRNNGFISDIIETDNDYQFYVVQNKYSAKMLGLSDIVQPESNVTVYEYIKRQLTAQKQNQFFAQAAQDMAKSLDTAANVERKKTGADLTKALSW